LDKVSHRLLRYKTNPIAQKLKVTGNSKKHYLTTESVHFSYNTNPPCFITQNPEVDFKKHCPKVSCRISLIKVVQYVSNKLSILQKMAFCPCIHFFTVFYVFILFYTQFYSIPRSIGNFLTQTPLGCSLDFP
jgi:hypothetical protein